MKIKIERSTVHRSVKFEFYNQYSDKLLLYVFWYYGYVRDVCKASKECFGLNSQKVNEYCWMVEIKFQTKLKSRCSLCVNRIIYLFQSNWKKGCSVAVSYRGYNEFLMEVRWIGECWSRVTSCIKEEWSGQKEVGCSVRDRTLRGNRERWICRQNIGV